MQPPAPLQPDSKTLVRIYEHMLLSRQLDELLAQTRVLGNPFYIGSTFEEPLAVIGMLMQVGSGIHHDVLAAYYRSLPILVGMGVPPASFMRQAAMRATDPFSAGRQMVNHFSEPDFNVIPVSSCVTVEAGKGFATAQVQRMLSDEPVLTVVHLGDAMCAEADFWVMLQEITLRQLPVLVLISNNGAGIHTPYAAGSAAPCQSAWGVGVQLATSSRPRDPHLRAYVASYSPDLPDVRYAESPRPGWEIVDGSDVASVYASAQVAFDYIRRERKPYLLEYRTERGRHHSSSSNPSGQILDELKERDPLQRFEQYLQAHKVLSAEQIVQLQAQTRAELLAQVEAVKAEPPARDATSGMYYTGEWALNG
ncbi:MAG: thiamine pyrophosphate-dependent enzyme [Candidatus Sericytochromatia bacterium]